MKFHNVQVLYNVDFTLKPGEVKGLVGKNGAGKSTLLKIVQGIHKPTGGTIQMLGESIAPTASIKEREKYVGMIYQDFSLIPEMTVVQNMFLNEELRSKGLINDKKCEQLAEELFRKYDIKINPREKVKNLNTSDMQMVEICKQLVREKRILLMDEPTAALEAEQAQKLYRIIRQLKAEGISIVFITHHLKEIMENCDSVDVLRDGHLVLSKEIGDTNLNEMISAMLGESSGEFASQRTYHPISQEEPLLEAVNVTSEILKTPLSFKLFPGEVLGIAGLKGSGRTELFHILFGLDKTNGGEIRFEGRPVKFGHPRDAVETGIYLIPENRQSQGLSIDHSLYSNSTLPWLRRLKKNGIFVNDRKGRKFVTELYKDLHLKYNHLDESVKSLSGGNQQKVVISKALGANPRVLLMDDPTYGVDVHAKAQIMGIINDFKLRGNSVIFVSSELEELAYNCDRILIMHRHEFVGELRNTDQIVITQEAIAEAIQ